MKTAMTLLLALSFSSFANDFVGNWKLKSCEKNVGYIFKDLSVEQIAEDHIVINELDSDVKFELKNVTISEDGNFIESKDSDSGRNKTVATACFESFKSKTQLQLLADGKLRFKRKTSAKRFYLAWSVIPVLDYITTDLDCTYER